MSAVAKAAHFSETDRLSGTESADHDDAGANDNGGVIDAYVNANLNRNPVKHRVLKTVCLCVSFGAMVRQLK